MKILITAGPTREAIDPVRFLSNRSSGKMGFAIAQAAAEAGHEVVLVAVPVAISAPDHDAVEVVPVVSALEMFAAVSERLGGCDAAVMAAAVCDYRPATTSDQKMKKAEGTLTIEFVRTPDILGSTRGELGFDGKLIGFAAETEDLEKNAAGKLERKGCDLIVANDVSQPGIGFGSDDNAVTLLFASGRRLPLPRASKREIAERLIAEIEGL